MHSFIHTFIAFEHYTVPVATGTGLLFIHHVDVFIGEKLEKVSRTLPSLAVVLTSRVLIISAGSACHCRRQQPCFLLRDGASLFLPSCEIELVCQN